MYAPFPTHESLLEHLVADRLLKRHAWAGELLGEHLRGKAGARFLDVGSGSGFMLEFMARAFPGTDV
ncbi:hypothetical protein KIPB_010510, partial [Kipferlia bialata]|eukprot:g10510.t1